MKHLLLFVSILLCLDGYLTKLGTAEQNMDIDIVREEEEDADLLDAFGDAPYEELDEGKEEEMNPCESVLCGPGRVCEEGKCVCIKECTAAVDRRRWVCSNRNTTFQSDCQLHRERCLCEHNRPECRMEDNRHLHIQYYGECTNIADCSEAELDNFPRRMRQWLFSVMDDLSEKGEISHHYTDLKHQTQHFNRWSLAAVWKWCDLDRQPHDNLVSRHELFPLRAPLHSLEHCISPFLNSCDKDGDHSISLQEWADCLELPVDDLKDKCEKIK